MFGSRLRALAWWALGSLPMGVAAQSPFAVTDSTKPQQTTEIGGQTSIDLVPCDPNSLSLSLRHGSVLTGSEVVTFGTKTLKKGTDYAIDAQYALHHTLILIFATLFLRTGRTEKRNTSCDLNRLL